MTFTTNNPTYIHFSATPYGKPLITMHLGRNINKTRDENAWRNSCLQEKRCQKAGAKRWMMGQECLTETELVER
jgi:hypothetical protein